MNIQNNILPASAPVTVQIHPDLELLTKRIHGRMKRTVEDIFENGRDLIKAKRLLGHGNFGIWLKEEFDLTEMTAKRFMNVAKRFDEEDKINKMLNLQPSVVYELAAPSTSDSVIKIVTEMAKNDEKLTVSTVKILKNEEKKDNSEAKNPVSVKLKPENDDVDEPTEENEDLDEPVVMAGVIEPTEENENLDGPVGKWKELNITDNCSSIGTDSGFIFLCDPKILSKGTAGIIKDAMEKVTGDTPQPIFGNEAYGSEFLGLLVPAKVGSDFGVSMRYQKNGAIYSVKIEKIPE